MSTLFGLRRPSRAAFIIKYVQLSDRANIIFGNLKRIVQGDSKVAPSRNCIKLNISDTVT